LLHGRLMLPSPESSSHCGAPYLQALSCSLRLALLWHRSLFPQHGLARISVLLSILARSLAPAPAWPSLLRSVVCWLLFAFPRSHDLLSSPAPLGPAPLTRQASHKPARESKHRRSRSLADSIASSDEVNTVRMKRTQTLFAFYLFTLTPRSLTQPNPGCRHPHDCSARIPSTASVGRRSSVL
jgi:hypothetical protein